MFHTLQDFHLQTQSLESLPHTFKKRMIKGLSLDSRTITQDDIFIAIQGQQTAGHTFIEQAIQKGALAVYTDQPIDKKQFSIPCFFIPNLAQKIPELARFFYGHPSQQLWVTAVTGTNGKSSTAYLLSHAHTLLGQSSYYIGTLGHGTVEHLKPLNCTTPDVIHLNHIMAQAAHGGAHYLNCEASSHGLHQNRLAGIQIKNAIFTNLTHDHLNYHGCMESYFQAKLKLFERPELEHCVLNLDDHYAEFIAQRLSPQVHCLTTSLTHGIADIYGRVLEQTKQGLKVEIRALGKQHVLTLPIIAEFQLANILSVLANLLTQQFDLQQCIHILPELNQVLGRMERWMLPNGATVLIDYAHTPDALLQALKGLKKQYTQVICVFGCGGEKDREKRPKMATIAESHSTQVIVTADNPRHEPFAQIVNDMMPGFKNPSTVIIEPDRRIAIMNAIQQSDSTTVILLAGKGQETYMDIQGVKYPFDEREVIKSLIQ